MSLKFSRMIALRYLWSRRREAFISFITVMSIVGVAIGVVVITVTMAIMTGFQYELRDKLVGAESHIAVRKVGGEISNWKKVVKKISEAEGIESVAAFTYNQALLRTKRSSSGLLIRGIQRGGAAERQLKRYLEQGQSLERLYDPPEVLVDGIDGKPERIKLPGIIVGRELMKTMGLFVGTPVALLSPQVSSTPMGLMPKFKRFVVAGSYNSGLVSYESGLAYMTLEDAQKFFGLGDKVSGIEVRVDDIDEAPLISKKISEKLGGFPYFTQDWTQINKPLWDAIKLEKKVYFIVLLLIVIMASFSIISTLSLMVMEKRGDIAVLKTMGAGKVAIGNIFRMQGSIIGLAGTVLGLAGGFAGCILLREYGFPLDESIFQMSTVPVRMEPINFALVGISAFLICFLATLYPAWKASSLEPSQVLRYE